ncbi:hypothetical protein D3C79_691750 [compost metagenome]
MIGVVEQYVLLGDGVEGVDEAIEITAIEGRQLGVFQIVPAHVGEADEILEVVIAPARHDGVVGADLQLELQETYHGGGHLPLVDEAHRHGGEALLQAITHLVHQAQIQLVGEIVLGIPGQLDRIGRYLVVVEEALEDLVQAEADDVVQDDDLLLAAGPLRRQLEEAGQIVGRHLHQGVLDHLAVLLHLDGEIGVLVFEELDRVDLLVEEDGDDMTQHLLLEEDPQPLLDRLGELVLVDQEDVVAGEGDQQLFIGVVEGLAERHHLLLDGAQQHLGVVIAAVHLVDEDAALDVRYPYLEELVLIGGEDPQKTDPLDEGDRLVHCLLQHPFIE